MRLLEQFLSPSIPANFYWFNEPTRYKFGNGLELYTDAQTDFWQTTHYGFQRDDGHCLFTKLSADFTISTHVEFQPQTQYDQCGLLVRVDAQNWIKVSTEYEDETESRLGSVVTNLGYSDWATQTISSAHQAMGYRLSKRGSDFLIEGSFDGESWQQLRIAHLHTIKDPLDVGVYACSPIGRTFYCRFSRLEIADNDWFYKEDIKS